MALAYAKNVEKCMMTPEQKFDEKRRKNRERFNKLRKVGYFSADDFLVDLRAGNLKDQFTLDEGTFRELAEMVNRDKELAGEVADNGVVLLLASLDKFETEGLIAMAEVCREG